jgi:hypothetical protein
MSTKKAATRRKVGRPPSPEGREKFTTTLPPGYADELAAIGQSITGLPNASAAIVWLVNEYKKAAGKL